MTAVLTQKESGVEQDDKTGGAETSTLPYASLSETAVKDLVKIFKLLADETRLRILFILHQTDEMNVLELCKLLRQRQPSVSHHLALLRVDGLIAMRREGKHNYYRILPKRFEEVVARVFNAAPGSPLRICFEEFELQYAPNKQSV